MKSQTVTEVAHDVVAVSPDTESNTNTTEAENPDGDFGLAAGENTGVPDLEDGGVGADGVGNVVGAVGERSSAGGHDLHEGVEELGLVVVVLNAGVHLLQISGKHTLLLLHVDDVLVDTGQENLLDHPEEDGTVVPGSLGAGADDRLVNVVVVTGSHGRGVGGVLDNLLLAIGGARLNVVAVSLGNNTATGGFKFLLGHVTGVEVTDATAAWGLGAAEQERAEEDVVPAQLPVILDDHAVQPRDEEDGDEQSPSSTNTNNHTGGLGIVEDGEINGRGGNSAAHAKHKESRVILEEVDIHNLR
ncbi:hypothetical protein ColTof3_05255 [Colletotrichum tofieldiae]|nr:hypothetical protein ColTof3_05255 [Colletotrichum tofieldiae]